jgi:hypothetical protein
VIAAAAVVVFAGGAPSTAAAPHAMASAAVEPALPACSNLDALGIPRQQNLRAYRAMVACGREGGGGTGPLSTVGAGKLQLGLANVDAINVDNAFPTVTQSEDQVFSNGGSMVIVHYNDSVGGSDISVSTDGGASFARQSPSPFASGQGGTSATRSSSSTRSSASGLPVTW